MTPAPDSSPSVWLITGEYPPDIGGVADYTALLAQHLTSRGYSITVVARTQSELPTRVGNDSPSIQPVSGWDPVSLVRLAWLLRQCQPDVVHLQYQAAPFNRSVALYAFPWIARAAGWRGRFVATFHDLREPYLFPKARRVRRTAIRSIMAASDRVVFTTAADLVQAGFPGKSTWVPIGPNVWPHEKLDGPDQRARWGLASEAKVIAYFGFLNESKGTDALADAAATLINQGAASHLMLVGDALGASDPSNRLVAEAAWGRLDTLGPDRVIRTGWLSPADTSAALSTADVAMLPYVDGASLRRGSLLACLAHGIPTITTRPRPEPTLEERNVVAPFEHQSEFAIDDELAVLVDTPASPGALVAAAQALLDDPARRAQLACGGRALAERLSWDAIAEAHDRVYEELSRSAGSAPL